MQQSNTPVAVKSRDYRRRRRAGAVVVRTEISVDAQQALINNAFLDDANRYDRAWIAAGITTLLEFLAEGSIVVAED